MTLKTAKVGDRVWFAEERLPYTVQARNARFLVCTKPFAARRTVLYSICDLKEQVRGTENLIFCMGFETKTLCEEALVRLAARESEVSHRNRTALRVARVQLMP